MTGPAVHLEGSQEKPRHTGNALLVAAMLLLAANLRPFLTEVAPVLPQIRADFGVSGAEASLLTTLPVLLFGLCASAMPSLMRRFGTERAVFLALVVLLAGGLARLIPTWPMLLAGTVVLGAAVAVCNVVLPVLVKTRFPDRTGSITGLYTMSLNVAAAAAAGTVVPLVALTGHGWRGGFAVWLIPIGVALVCWAPLALVRRGCQVKQAAIALPVFVLLRNSRARALVIFTASQSVIYYGMVAWLPSIFQHHGVSPSDSGILLAVATLVGAPVALVVPTMAARAVNQRGHVLVLAAFAGVGLIGLLVAPVAAPYLWAVLLGIGQGGVFPLALTLFVLRTATGAETAGISVLAQSVAYVFAAVGPLTMGIMRDRTGSWKAAIVVLLVCLLVEAVSGLHAGGPGRLSLRVEPPAPSETAVAVPNGPPTTIQPGAPTGDFTGPHPAEQSPRSTTGIGEDR